MSSQATGVLDAVDGSVPCTEFEPRADQVPDAVRHVCHRRIRRHLWRRLAPFMIPGKHCRHIPLRFPEGWDAQTVAQNRILARIVGSQHKVDAIVEEPHEIAEVARARAKICFRRTAGIRDTMSRGGSGQHLHQAYGTHCGACHRVVVGFNGNYGMHQSRVESLLTRGLVDLPDKTPASESRGDCRFLPRFDCRRARIRGSEAKNRVVFDAKSICGNIRKGRVCCEGSCVAKGNGQQREHTSQADPRDAVADRGN